MTAQQLDDLVAPIALYPDPLLSQARAASTYPVEIGQAEQWVKDHPNWKGSKLMKEAKKQNWDPSAQGLTAFPQTLTLLSQNINWTTQLGNAFLAQQMDVMEAVQRMRAQAQAKGMLQSTSQQVVSTQMQDGRTAITIEPANPDLWYVPYYNPAYMGASSVGILSASVVSGDRSGSGVVSGHRSGPPFWRLGRLGVGQLELGAKLVRRQHLYRPFFLSSLWFPGRGRRATGQYSVGAQSGAQIRRSLRQSRSSRPFCTWSCFHRPASGFSTGRDGPTAALWKSSI